MNAEVIYIISLHLSDTDIDVYEVLLFECSLPDQEAVVIPCNKSEPIVLMKGDINTRFYDAKSNLISFALSRPLKIDVLPGRSWQTITFDLDQSRNAMEIQQMENSKEFFSQNANAHLQVTPEELQSKMEKPHESQTSSTHQEDPRPSKNLDSVSQVGDKEFSYGDLVWAKMKSYPPWPGIIVMEPQSQEFKKDKTLYKRGGKTSETKLYFVLFLNGNDGVAWIKKADMSRYETQSSKKRCEGKVSGGMLRCSSRTLTINT